MFFICPQCCHWVVLPPAFSPWSACETLLSRLLAPALVCLRKGGVLLQPLHVWPRCFVIISYVFRNCLLKSLAFSALQRTHVGRSSPAALGCKHARALEHKDAHGCKQAYTNAVKAFKSYAGQRKISAPVTYGGEEVSVSAALC